MLLVIISCVAPALTIAVPWDAIGVVFEPMFLLWGDIMTG